MRATVSRQLKSMDRNRSLSISVLRKGMLLVAVVVVFIKIWE
jgi:hypothetical protein